MPQTSDDVARMERVLGPASALYGLNYTGGVLQIITRSPFENQGIQVLAQGGSRDFAKAQIRLAGAIGDKFAAKISGSLLSLTDWPISDDDPYRQQELAARADYIKATGDTTSFTGRNIGIRPSTARRATVDGRIDVRPVEGLNIATSAGDFKGSWLELTGLGDSYNNGFGYGHVQSRVTYGNLCAQVYTNFNRGNDTYRIPLGTLTQDLSRQSGAQAQFAPTYGPLSLVLGGDFYARYEPQDRFVIGGAYAQGTYAVSPKLDLVASGRIDHHTFIDKAMFSPRAAIVFKPGSDARIMDRAQRLLPVRYWRIVGALEAREITRLGGAAMLANRRAVRHARPPAPPASDA